MKIIYKNYVIEPEPLAPSSFKVYKTYFSKNQDGIDAERVKVLGHGVTLPRSVNYIISDLLLERKKDVSLTEFLEEWRTLQADIVDCTDVLSYLK